MHKKIIFSLIVFSFISLSSCGSTNSSAEVIDTDLARVFHNMKENNFTVDYTDSLMNNDKVERNQVFKYTSYSVESNGDLSFNGYAETDDTVFKYVLEDDNIVSSLPTLDSTGKRYEHLYSRIIGMEDFDISYLPKEKDEEGYYNYTFGLNETNDVIFYSVFLNRTYNAEGISEYASYRLKVIGNTVTLNAKLLRYTLSEGVFYDEVTTIIYNIGTTENLEIKNYLASGKGAKKELDLNFFKTIQPYLTSNNYTLYVSGEELFDSASQSFKMTEYCLDNAYMADDGNSKAGCILAHDVVSTFTIDENDKLNITSTPTNSDNEFYETLYGEYVATSFSDIDYDLFIGYIDEEHDNSYYLIDSQLIYILSYICYAEVQDSMYCDKVRFEIVDEDKHEFNLYFDFYNRTTGIELGTYKASFYNQGKTSISSVDNYLKQGDEPTEDKTGLMNILNEFKTANYSCDILSSAGLIKRYYNENYFYEEVYGNTSNNVGYIKQGEAIYEFTITDGKMDVTDTKDLSSTISLPGTGTYFGYSDDDLGYISHFDDEIYNMNNYEISSIMGKNYYHITSLSLSNKFFKYIFLDQDSILNNGVGLLYSSSNTDKRLTFVFSYIASDGSYEGNYAITYYDIGMTSNAIIDAYLANL